MKPKRETILERVSFTAIVLQSSKKTNIRLKSRHRLFITDTKLADTSADPSFSTITHPDPRSRTASSTFMTVQRIDDFLSKTVASRFGGTAVTIITPYRGNRQRVVGSHAESPMGCMLSGSEPYPPPFSLHSNPLEERWKRYTSPLWESRSLEPQGKQLWSRLVSSLIRAI